MPAVVLGRGQLLLGDDRKPSPYTEQVLKFLQDFQARFQRTRAFCKRIKEYGVLEPMQAQVGNPTLLAYNSVRISGITASFREEGAAGHPKLWSAHHEHQRHRPRAWPRLQRECDVSVAPALLLCVAGSVLVLYLALTALMDEPAPAQAGTPCRPRGAMRCVKLGCHGRLVEHRADCRLGVSHSAAQASCKPAQPCRSSAVPCVVPAPNAHRPICRPAPLCRNTVSRARGIELDEVLPCRRISFHTRCSGKRRRLQTGPQPRGPTSDREGYGPRGPPGS